MSRFMPRLVPYTRRDWSLGFAVGRSDGYYFALLGPLLLTWDNA